MDYTNQIGLISKPLLREVAREIKKKLGTRKSIQVSKFPQKISEIFPIRLTGVYVCDDFPAQQTVVTNTEMQKVFDGFKVTVKIQ